MISYRYCRLYNIYHKITMDFGLFGIGLHIRESIPYFLLCRLRDVTLDTGILAAGKPPPLARGVELCDCPPQYNASSCQDPSIGFYRWYDNNSISSTIVIQLVGEARPCQCSQRSRVCHIETGYCLVSSWEVS